MQFDSWTYCSRAFRTAFENQDGLLIDLKTCIELPAFENLIHKLTHIQKKQKTPKGKNNEKRPPHICKIKSFLLGYERCRIITEH